jgi:hypothetical protein
VPTNERFPERLRLVAFFVKKYAVALVLRLAAGVDREAHQSAR